MSESCNVIMKAVGRIRVAPLPQFPGPAKIAEHVAKTPKHFQKGIPGSLEVTGLVPCTFI